VYSETVAQARDYYDSKNMLNFHNFIYGEHIHIGLYQTGSESIPEANLHTLDTINTLLKLTAEDRVLDLGSGYGGAARYFARTAHCQIDCLNLSSAQNAINRDLNQQQGLDALIQVLDGSFQTIPTASDRYHTVLSQDALLYSSDRRQVFQEIARVLKHSGQLLLTDVMLHDNCPADMRQETLNIVGLASLATVATYRTLAAEVGFDVIQILEMPAQVTRQYQKTLDALEQHFATLLTMCDRPFLEYQRSRLGNWITVGQQGYLNWGILHFRKR